MAGSPPRYGRAATASRCSPPLRSARDLRAGRRTLAGGGEAALIALCPAIPVSRQSRMGVPVGARANLALALAGGEFDVVHGFEPGLPSFSYLALRDAEAIAVATFFSPERLGYPPREALANGSSAASTRCSRPRPTRPKPPPSASRATTGSFRPASIRSSSGRPRSAASS